MSAALEDWQARLERHFAELHAQRRDRPLFALEHGLSQPEVADLGAAVRAHVFSRLPSVLHNLVWIVYAAEIGYGYEGDEYWQTFEHKTPGWIIHGDRDWIRERYKSFHRKYGGAAPSGPWADHFSIICWPITHAILPTDLQRQLARTLYDLRHFFSRDLFDSPTALGEAIAGRTFHATSRFQNLIQETQLVGQIAAALLLQGEFGTAGLLHPAALQRISADLNGERLARRWLHDARQVAKERATVRGLSIPRAGVFPQRPEEARAEIAALGIEPRLVLRPKNRPQTSWEVYLEIPDLTHLPLRFPKARQVLMESRCVVAGSSGRPRARGEFLYGSQRVALSRWPRADEILLQFERREPQLEFLLRTECMLRPGPMWLFRVASDGLAYESRSMRVRPGETYVIACTANIKNAEGVTAVELECDGINGAMLTLPTAISHAWENTLQQLGVRQARTLEVWPAGLAAAMWDGEGRGEWLASERPCLGIRTDHSVDAVVVSMDSVSQPLVIEQVRPGEAEFIELPRLAVGLHRIRFLTRSAGGHADTIGDLDVLMRVREARPWSPKAGSRGPLLPRIEPGTPTLEQLWEGQVEITVEGPAGRHLRCSVSLFDAAPHNTITKALAPLVLPVEPATWARHFRAVCEQGDIAAAYDTAAACELSFAADELGAFSLRCEREFTPLRWAVRRAGPGYLARLLNDSGDSVPPVVVRRAFETPLVEEPLHTDMAYAVPGAGGMYVARHKHTTSAIIVPPVVRGLADFGCTPRVDDPGQSASAAFRLCAAAELWSSAKLSGNVFSAARQRAVLSAIDQYVARMLYGREWMLAEHRFRTGVNTVAHLQRAVWNYNDEAEAGVRLGRRYVELSASGLRERIREIAGIARFLGVRGAKTAQQPPDSIAEFALRVGSDPAAVTAWAGGAFEASFVRLERCPTLAKAARFLVIAIDHHLEAGSQGRELYASWRWQ